MPRSTGALLLPQRAEGQINWPACSVCLRIVDAYGIAEETDDYIELWARCDTHKINGQPAKDVVRIDKHAAWGPNTLSSMLRFVGFFAKTGGLKRWDGRLNDFSKDPRDALFAKLKREAERPVTPPKPKPHRNRRGRVWA
jgi:hypothetical protein